MASINNILFLFAILGFSAVVLSQEPSSPSPQRLDEEHAAQDQAFFARVIRCNFATEGGSRCTSCHTVRRCYPFLNIGTVTTCSGFLQYCRDGRCSFRKGPLCSPTTSTTTTKHTTKHTTAKPATTTNADTTTDADTTTEADTTTAADTTTEAGTTTTG